MDRGRKCGVHTGEHKPGAVSVHSPYSPDWSTPEKYIKAKVTMLEKEFKIRLTYAEKAHLEELKTQVAIDNAIRKIIMDKL